MKSIEKMLLGWVLSTLMIGAAALVGGSYWLYRDELGEVFDENLKEVALATAYDYSADTGQSRAVVPPDHVRTGVTLQLPPLPRIYDSIGDFDFVTLVWTPKGEPVFISDPTVSIPFIDKTGPQLLERDDGDWHVYTIVLPEMVVQAAQRDEARSTLAAEVASKMVLPLTALVALIGVLLLLALRKGLRSLDTAAASVADRTEHSLVPISADKLPREIHTLIQAINALMARLSTAFSAQRRFVADAAHELRTPVTALRLQLQLLERAPDEAHRAEAIADLRKGVGRAQNLIEQLLNLSRYEPRLPNPAVDHEQTSAMRDLGQLVRDVVSTLSLQAEHRGIDLGAEAEPGVMVPTQGDELLVLLNNLVGNALRYTPEGGVVDVRASRTAEGLAQLQVIDNGPGIPEPERARVFDRFYRGSTALGSTDGGPGSGLGLAIVKAIADRHHAAVSLLTAPSGQGLEVRVVFGA